MNFAEECLIEQSKYSETDMSSLYYEVSCGYIIISLVIWNALSILLQAKSDKKIKIYT